LNREEFVVVGWTDPDGSRSRIDALSSGYYTEDGRLHYAGRAGTGITTKELKRLAQMLAPLQVPKMPQAELPTAYEISRAVALPAHLCCVLSRTG
jgi:bifunctional non-homologous end joining protein LigD